MDKKLTIWKLRRYMGKSGWAMLVYYLLINVSVIISVLIEVIAQSASGALNSAEDLDRILMGNAWGYIIASGIGALIMFFWKKKQFCLVELWRREKAMNGRSFLGILVIFLGAQGAFQLLAIGFELLLNLFGFSAMTAIDQASSVPDTFSMFLYIGFVAPFAEELLFRGLLLRMMRPYGKLFAIITTSFLFGMYHGNPVQTPFAFLIGLILSYVTVEYSLGWAIVLHTINNLVLGDLMTRLSKLLPPGLTDVLLAGVIWFCFFCGLVLLICNRKKISTYCAENRIHPWCSKAFFGAPSVVAFTVLMALSMLFGIKMI